MKSIKPEAANAREIRASNYPSMGDQLDAIMKAMAALKAQGVALPKQTEDWIDECQRVKRDNPV